MGVCGVTRATFFNLFSHICPGKGGLALRCCTLAFTCAQRRSAFPLLMQGIVGVFWTGFEGASPPLL